SSFSCSSCVSSATLREKHALLVSRDINLPCFHITIISFSHHKQEFQVFVTGLFKPWRQYPLTLSMDQRGCSRSIERDFCPHGKNETHPWNLATMQYWLTLLYWPGLIHVVTEIAQW